MNSMINNNIKKPEVFLVDVKIATLHTINMMLLLYFIVVFSLFQKPGKFHQKYQKHIIKDEE